jgi:DnaJ-class molecular chaperone
MTYIGPTDGNLHALRKREQEIEDYDARWIDCPDCGGAGRIFVPLGFHTGDPETDDWDEDECETCRGTGQIERDDWEDE